MAPVLEMRLRFDKFSTWRINKLARFALPNIEALLESKINDAAEFAQSSIWQFWSSKKEIKMKLLNKKFDQLMMSVFG